jgi:hypothetical protein
MLKLVSGFDRGLGFFRGSTRYILIESVRPPRKTEGS